MEGGHGLEGKRVKQKELGPPSNTTILSTGRLGSKDSQGFPLLARETRFQHPTMDRTMEDLATKAMDIQQQLRVLRRKIQH